MAEDETEPPPQPQIGVYACPHCDQSVAVDPDEPGPFIHCPYCGGEFAVTAGEGAEQDDAETQAKETAERARESELDGMRIRQLSGARRAAIRARTYLFVGIVACATGGVQLVIKTVQRVRYEKVWDLRTFAFIGSAVASFAIATYFLRRWLELGRELAQPLLQDPATPPDFSTLSDGSQRWKDLEDIR